MILASKKYLYLILYLFKIEKIWAWIDSPPNDSTAVDSTIFKSMDKLVWDNNFNPDVISKILLISDVVIKLKWNIAETIDVIIKNTVMIPNINASVFKLSMIASRNILIISIFFDLNSSIWLE